MDHVTAQGAGALTGEPQSAHILSTEQTRFASQFSDSIGETQIVDGWFWPLLSAFAVVGLLLALRELLRKRREAFA